LKLGPLQITPGVICALHALHPESGARAFEAVQALIERHKSRDWGELSPDDKNANDLDQYDPAGHVLSAYTLGDADKTRVWIETCWNEDGYRYTVVMLPEER
jgi:hypothetical protein